MRFACALVTNHYQLSGMPWHSWALVSPSSHSSMIAMNCRVPDCIPDQGSAVSRHSNLLYLKCLSRMRINCHSKSRYRRSWFLLFALFSKYSYPFAAMSGNIVNHTGAGCAFPILQYITEYFYFRYSTESQLTVLIPDICCILSQRNDGQIL